MFGSLSIPIDPDRFLSLSQQILEPKLRYVFLLTTTIVFLYILKSQCYQGHVLFSAADNFNEDSPYQTAQITYFFLRSNGHAAK